jgi:hypothetical protein
MALQRRRAAALFEKDGCGEVWRSAYNERHELDPVISELSSRIITIEVIWNGRV